MSEHGARACPPSAVAGDSGPAVLIAALRESGAHRFDPVRFRFAEALDRRAAAHEGEARRVLDGRLAEVLAAYAKRFEAARAAAAVDLYHWVTNFPAAEEELRSLHAGNDVRALRRLSTRLALAAQGGPMSELLRHIARHTSNDADGFSADDGWADMGAPVELKALSRFRSTWSKLSVDRQLSRSLAQGEENAGPLNSHHVALRSIRLMHDISPDYLSRFMAYVDALAWLEQAAAASATAQSKASGGEGEKKRKSGRRGGR